MKIEVHQMQQGVVGVVEYSCPWTRSGSSSYSYKTRRAGPNPVVVVSLAVRLCRQWLAALWSVPLYHKC